MLVLLLAILSYRPEGSVGVGLTSSPGGRWGGARIQGMGSEEERGGKDEELDMGVVLQKP